MSRILVVDDDPLVLEHARLCLGRAGHAVLTAADGEAGLRLARENDVDLVISDVYMPGMDGFGLAGALRECLGPCPPPVIFMSSVEDRTSYRRAFGLRAADFLIKPVSCEDLCRCVQQRQEQAAADRKPAGVRVAGYRTVRPLGEGGSGSVHLAVRTRTGEECALKTIVIPESLDGQAAVIARFQSECAILEGLDDPGVARVIDHGVDDNCLYIAMEYLPGGSLARELGKPFPAERALEECRQVARALGTLHASGVVHRDVKPSNLMRRADGGLALVDFGIARRVESHDLTTHGHVIGTPAYMSPEQFNGERADARSDIYSLGCVLYEMLTGERAFRAETMPALFAAHVAGPRPALPEPLAYLQALLDRLLAIARKDRFPDGASVAVAMEALASQARLRRERVATFGSVDLEV
ncbi:MAG: protein kinase [Burkholderiales bacterium]|nr:protein kinase [Burkholderiales bacterium]